MPDNDSACTAASQAAMCADIPRQDRFDRITRTDQRLLQVPIVLMFIVDDDVQWFRSAQGLTVSETSRNISFCGHATITPYVFEASDTLEDRRFADNPRVIGSPYIRFCCGWPLEIALGLRVGTLCVLDTMPRTFSAEDIESLADFAYMVESEPLQEQTSAFVQVGKPTPEAGIVSPQKLVNSSTGFVLVSTNALKAPAARVEQALGRLAEHQTAPSALSSVLSPDFSSDFC